AAGGDVGALIDGAVDEHAAKSEANAPPVKPTVTRVSSVLRVNPSGERIRLCGSFYCSLSEDLRQVGFVFGTAAQVAGRLETLRGFPGGFSWRSPRSQGLFHRLSTNRRRCCIGDANPPLAVVHSLRRRRHYRPVRH